MMFGDQPTHLFTNHCSSTRWMKTIHPIMNEKSSTWMKHRNKNNYVAGLNWCWTWPFAKSIHEAFEPPKCPNLWVWKNEKKNKIKRRSESSLDWIALPPYPKAPFSLPNLGSLEKCSKAHINGNGAISSSHSSLLPFFSFFSFLSSFLSSLLSSLHFYLFSSSFFFSSSSSSPWVVATCCSFSFFSHVEFRANNNISC